jgi:hypothetical protein
VYQTTKMLAVLTSSRASPLPQWRAVFQILLVVC